MIQFHGMEKQQVEELKEISQRLKTLIAVTDSTSILFHLDEADESLELALAEATA